MKDLRADTWIPFTSIATNEWLQALLDARTDISVLRCWYLTVPSDWQLPPRTLSDHLLYFLVEGACEGEIAGQPVACTAGTLFWISPGVPHAFHLISPERTMTTYRFRFSVIRDGLGLRPDEDAVVLQNAWQVSGMLKDIYDELRLDLPYQSQRLHGLMGACFSSLLREHAMSQQSANLISGAQRAILYQYLSEHLHERPTSAELAAQIHLSPDYFTRLFTRTFGVSPRAWIKRERILTAAQQLLDTTRPLTQIAQQFGYDDLFLFSRQFKEVMGCAPTRYRQRAVRRGAHQAQDDVTRG